MYICMAKISAFINTRNKISKIRWTSLIAITLNAYISILYPYKELTVLYSTAVQYLQVLLRDFANRNTVNYLLHTDFCEDPIQAFGTTGCAKFFCIIPYNLIVLARGGALF